MNRIFSNAGRQQHPPSARAVACAFRLAGVLFLLLLVLPTGCCSLSHRPDTATIAACRPQEPFPPRFRSRETLVFSYRPHWWWPKLQFAAVGYAVVDRPARTFTAACVSPMGIKIFELAYSNGTYRVESSFPLPGDADQARASIAADIASVFLDELPPPGDTPDVCGDELLFREERNGARTDRVFAIPSGQLLRKDIVTRDSHRSLTFEAAPREDGRDIPVTVELRNRRYGYSLRMQMQEVTAVP